jgi:hypothetical protein
MPRRSETVHPLDSFIRARREHEKSIAFLRLFNRPFNQRCGFGLTSTMVLKSYRESMRPRQALDLVGVELEAARLWHPRPFASAHEGYAVILEELDELFDEVRGINGKEEPHLRRRLRKEAIQVAAMAVRFLLDLHLVEEPEAEVRS